LDERRAKFKANLWNRPNQKEAKLGVDGQKPKVVDKHSPNGDLKKQRQTLKAMERKYSEGGDRPTDIEEVRI